MAGVDLPSFDSDPLRETIARPVYRVDFCAGERAYVRTLARRFFGRFDPEALVALAGALPGAHLEIGVYGGGLYLDHSDPPRHRYRGVACIVPRRGRPMLVIDALHIHRPTLRGRGLGLRIFARQLAAADRLGLQRIETHAGRQDDENGYYTWPRYGFAGRLPDAVRHRLPSELSMASDVLDLMRSEAGRVWWRRFGVAMRVTFDLRGDSPSRHAFRKYRLEREAAAYSSSVRLRK